LVSSPARPQMSRPRWCRRRRRLFSSSSSSALFSESRVSAQVAVVGVRRHSFLVIFGPFPGIQSFGPGRSCGVYGDILFCVIFGPFPGIQSFGPGRSCGFASTFFGDFRPFFGKSRVSAQAAAVGLRRDSFLCHFRPFFRKSRVSAQLADVGSTVTFFFGHFACSTAKMPRSAFPLGMEVQGAWATGGSRMSLYRG